MENCFGKVVAKYKADNRIEDDEILELHDMNGDVVGLCRFDGLIFFANVLGQYNFVVHNGCWFDRGDILLFLLKGDYHVRKTGDRYVDDIMAKQIGHPFRWNGQK